MRIAYFLADHGIPVFGDKGASVHVRHLAGALCGLGHEVTVFCARHGGLREAPFTVHKIEAPAVAAPPESGDPLAPRRAKERRYLATGERLLETFLATHRQRPFDAIYERYSLWSAAGVRAAARTGLPLVVEVNAPLLLEQEAYRQLVLATEAEAVEREVFTGAARLAAVSGTLAEYMIRRGAPPERIAVIPNGVDPRLFHPGRAATPLPEAEGRTVIAFSGSLKAWHGVDLLFDAFRELDRRLAGLHLLVVGDGPMRQWLEGYARGAGLEHRITFTGWRPHEAVAGLLARADIAVAPYPELDEFYFSPLKVFEYLALGKAVVASDIGQIRELIRHEENGLLVAPGDSAALAGALERLVVDAELRNRLGAGAALEAANHTWDRNARRVEALFLEQASPRRHSAP